MEVAFGENWDAYVEHYLTYGINEKRTAGVYFDPIAYAEAYSDIKAAFGDDYMAIINHYLTYGIKEGRTAGVIVEEQPQATIGNGASADSGSNSDNSTNGDAENGGSTGGDTGNGGSTGGDSGNDDGSVSGGDAGNGGSVSGGDAGNGGSTGGDTGNGGSTGGNTGSDGSVSDGDAGNGGQGIANDVIGGEKVNPAVPWENAGLEDHVMDWQDEKLEEAMRTITGIQDREIMLSDVWDYTALSFSTRTWDPGNGMEYEGGYGFWYIIGSEISNVTALGELTNLVSLNLAR